mmetsp:Transcript_19480/g.28657  ORF Transcript_19480/g.28657 Transcript_19480/m.28657 type:complete len:248 (-) Transcript_19480:593-1336(-)
MNSSNDVETEREAQSNPKRKQLSNEQRAAIVQALLERSTKKVLKRGAIYEVARQFDVNRAAIRRVWSRAIESLTDGNVLMDGSSKKSNCGRKKKNFQQQISSILDIPLNQRGTIRSTSAALGIPVATLHARLKEGQIRSHTNAVKPFLTEQNVKARLEFCLKHVQMESKMFNEMMDVIHVDEKWFYMTQNMRRYYLVSDEEEPHRTTKSKRYSTKVMFLAAVAHPHWDTRRNQCFDGKLGILPFITI